MDLKPKTMIVTGASQGIGAGTTRALLERGYHVVANALDITHSEFQPSSSLALVDGDVSQPATAAALRETAIGKFGSIDGVINNAGIYFSKPFTEYTTADFQRLSNTNLLGYMHVTQAAVKQMLAQQTGGSVIAITSAMVNHPMADANASIPMATKGGLEAITRSLALEYAKQRIRFNAVAPGVVNTPMHGGQAPASLKSLSPMGEVSEVADIVDAIIYLVEARHVTGEVLHVDAGMHNGKW